MDADTTRAKPPEREENAAWDERIFDLVPSGVDETQIAENLRLTPSERLRRLQDALNSLQAAGALTS